VRLPGLAAAGGMTMLIATHEMGFARDTANRVCFLEEGRIIEDAPPAELFIWFCPSSD
jgi:polar amino acid transport system ATP-binding protein